MLAAVIAVVIALAGIAWLRAPATSQSTDDAYLKADSTDVAPRVAGLVTEVLVRDNQKARAGDPLIRLDRAPFDARVAAAESSLADAEAGVASARAALAGFAADEHLPLRRSMRRRRRSARPMPNMIRATADRDRFDALLKQGFATRRDVDRMRATAIGAASAPSAHARGSRRGQPAGGGDQGQAPGA